MSGELKGNWVEITEFASGLRQVIEEIAAGRAGLMRHLEQLGQSTWTDHNYQAYCGAFEEGSGHLRNAEGLLLEQADKLVALAQQYQGVRYGSAGGGSPSAQPSAAAHRGRSGATQSRVNADTTLWWQSEEMESARAHYGSDWLSTFTETGFSDAHIITGDGWKRHRRGRHTLSGCHDGLQLVERYLDDLPDGLAVSRCFLNGAPISESTLRERLTSAVVSAQTRRALVGDHVARTGPLTGTLALGATSGGALNDGDTLHIDYETAAGQTIKKTVIWGLSGRWPEYKTKIEGVLREQVRCGEFPKHGTFRFRLGQQKWQGFYHRDQGVRTVYPAHPAASN